MRTYEHGKAWRAGGHSCSVSVHQQHQANAAPGHVPVVDHAFSQAMSDSSRLAVSCSGRAAVTRFPAPLLLGLNFFLLQDRWSRRRVSFHPTSTFLAYRIARRCPRKRVFFLAVRSCCTTKAAALVATLVLRAAGAGVIFCTAFQVQLRSILSDCRASRNAILFSCGYCCTLKPRPDPQPCS